MGSSMNAASYVEWSELSGLYLRNVSHLDRYQTFRPLISPAGLTTIVVAEFLNGNPGEVNVTDWRTHSVYESGSEGHERAEFTAIALEAIGATRVAEAVRTARSNSPFEMLRNMDPKNPQAMLEAMRNIGAPAMLNLREGIARMMPDTAAKAGLAAAPQQTPPSAEGEAAYETREQIDALLAQFVTDHQSELEADLARHGDPRTASGYTRKTRLTELDRLRRRQGAREAQREDAGKLNRLIDRLCKKVQTVGDDPRALLKLEADRRRFRQFRDLVKEHRSGALEDLLPEMREALQAADNFMQSFPQLFSQAVTGDPQLDARFKSLGEFECEQSENEWEIEWDNPTCFSGAWGEFALFLTLPVKKTKEAAHKLLDAVDRLRPRLAEVADVWKRELVDHFRNHEVQMSDWELEDYEAADDGQVTEASILEHAGKGSICLEFDDGNVIGRTQYKVDWDEEHGCEIEWDEELLEALTRDGATSAKSAPQENLPDWLKHIRNDDVTSFLAWLGAGGDLKAKHQTYGRLPMTVLDYITSEASPELVRELLARKHIKPKQIRESWQFYCQADINRFRALMPVLDKTLRPAVLQSHGVWEHLDLLEELAAAGIDFNAAVGREGATPIHLAVQSGNKAAVKWLMDHGANPRKPDKYRRDAFVWAENGPGYECLPILEGRPEPQATGDASPDVPGIGILWEATARLPAQWGLALTIQIKTPPVTRIEKTYYPEECHYLLSIDICRKHVTVKDMHTPRQDYLHAGEWPSFLFAPILQWPDLKPLWETLEVHEFDWPTAMKKRKYQPIARPELLDAARAALEQAFDSHEATARGIRLTK